MRVLQEKERGRGWPSGRGMLEAIGECRLFSDADLSVPVSEISRFLPPLLTDFNVAIASRELPGSVRSGEPAWRHLVGRAFNAMIRAMVLPGFQDTQCGFKCFRAAAAQDIFLRQRLSGMAFERGSDLHCASPGLPDQGSAGALALRSGLARAAGAGFDRDGLRPGERNMDERPARII